MKKHRSGEKREAHALDSIVVIKNQKSWEKRVKEWQAPMEFNGRISWLHTNHMREGNGPEKFIFYLEVADGYGDKDIFRGSNEKWKISQKAFTILCNFFFVNGENSPCPFIVPYQEPLFSKLLWFFRPYGGMGGWNNLRPRDTSGLGKDGGRHYLSIARKYAESFVLDAWQLLNRTWYKCWEVNPDPKVADPHLLQITLLLHHIGMLEHLESRQYTPSPDVFKKLLRAVFLQNTIAWEENSLDDAKYVGTLLEPLVKKEDRLAKALYFARLNVNSESMHPGRYAL